ncbi:MAG: GNAT family N-acetyltransferase [Roseobacter sp.]
MQIRRATKEDTDALAQIFYKSVREGPSLYTQAQRVAWMPAVPQHARFATRLAPMWVYVAAENGRVFGFMGTEPSGYIDLAFILPQYRGKGAFRLLFEATRTQAIACALGRLWTHASLTAQPAFKAMGFSVIQHETVERTGEMLQRAEMETYLS